MSDSDVPAVPSASKTTVSEQPQELTGQTDVPIKPAPVLSPPSKAPASESPGAEPAGPPTPQGSAASSAASVATSGDDGMSREVRLGLVLYGGVSLAIYMNGVAQEFFNAVRGRGIYALIKALTDSDIIVDIMSGASAGGVNGIFLAFALCNEKEFASFAELWRNQGDVSLLLRDPTQDPDNCHSLFDSQGYYQPKLQDAFETMFYRSISEQTRSREFPSKFKEVDLFIAGSDVEGRVFSTYDDLGQTIDVKDHRVIFQVKHRDGRKEQFNPHADADGSVRAELSPADQRAREKVAFESLAKLARLTSCFPAAFEPVQITRPDKNSKDSADDRLRRWGGFRQDAFFTRGQSKYFVDGGVLNNKPFTSTFDEILYRMADSDVQRFLMYVEPDPERFHPPVGVFPEPSFSTTIFDSLVSLPGYQSIASDLRAVVEHNTEVERYERLTAQFRAEVDAHSARALKLTDSPSYGLYLRARMGAMSERVAQGTLRENGVDPLLQTQRQKEAARLLLSEFDQLVACIDPDAQQEILKKFDFHFPQRRLFETVRRIKTLLYPSEPVKIPPNCRPDLKEFLEQEQANIKKAGANKDAYTRLWIALNRQIELLQIVQLAAEQMLDQGRLPWPRKKAQDGSGPPEITGADVWSIVEAMVQKLLDPGWLWARLESQVRVANQSRAGDRKIRDMEFNYPDTWPTVETAETGPIEKWGALTAADLKERWLTQDWLSQLNDILSERSKKICDALCDVDRDSAPGAFLDAVNAVEGTGSTTTVLPDVEACSLRILDTLIEPADPVRCTYDHFEALDALLYPMDLAAGLRSKNKINLLRISPFDAQKGFSKLPIEKKVTGLQFFHFGAFFKRSWRSNDILWGRLDAACQLTECLLTKDRLRQVGDDPNLRDKVRRRLGLDPNVKGELSLADILPQMDRKALLEWLGRLLSGIPAEREDALSKFDADQDGWQTRLIEAAQAAIIDEDLEGVIVDAAGEQMEWNQYVAPGEPRPPSGQSNLALQLPQFQFQGGSGKLDTTVIAISSAELAKRAAKELPDKPAFFRNKYAVGSQELLEDIPTVILLEIVAKAMLVLRNCVLTNLGPAAEKVKAAKAFNWFVDIPLKVFYNYVLWWRRAPAAHRYTQASIFLVASAILAIGFIWREPLFFPLDPVAHQRMFQWNSFGYFVIGAAAIVIVTLIAFWKGSNRLLRRMILAGMTLLGGGVLARYVWPNSTLFKNLQAQLGHNAPALLGFLVPAGLLLLGFLAGRWWPRRPKTSPAGKP